MLPGDWIFDHSMCYSTTESGAHSELLESEVCCTVCIWYISKLVTSIIEKLRGNQVSFLVYHNWKAAEASQTCRKFLFYFLKYPHGLHMITGSAFINGTIHIMFTSKFLSLLLTEFYKLGEFWKLETKRFSKMSLVTLIDKVLPEIFATKEKKNFLDFLFLHI